MVGIAVQVKAAAGIARFFPVFAQGAAVIDGFDQAGAGRLAGFGFRHGPFADPEIELVMRRRQTGGRGQGGQRKQQQNRKPTKHDVSQIFHPDNVASMGSLCLNVHLRTSLRGLP